MPPTLIPPPPKLRLCRDGNSQFFNVVFTQLQQPLDLTYYNNLHTSEHFLKIQALWRDSVSLGRAAEHIDTVLRTSDDFAPCRRRNGYVNSSNFVPPPHPKADLAASLVGTELVRCVCVCVCVCECVCVRARARACVRCSTVAQHVSTACSESC